MPAVAVKQEELMLIILRCKTSLDFFYLDLNINIKVDLIFKNLLEFIIRNWNFLWRGGILSSKKEYRILKNISIIN